MNMISENFWGEEGYHVVNNYVKENFKHLLQFQGFLIERSNIEAELSKSLKRIAKKVEMNIDGRLSVAMLRLRDELEKDSTLHKEFSAELKMSANALLTFHRKLKKQAKVHLGEVEKSNKEYQLLLENIDRHKNKYHKLCAECYELDTKLRLEINPKIISKIQTAKQKVAKSQSVAEQEYRASIDKLAAYCPQHKPRVQNSYNTLQETLVQLLQLFKQTAVHQNDVYKPMENRVKDVIYTMNQLLKIDVVEDINAWVSKNKVSDVEPQWPNFQPFDETTSGELNECNNNHSTTSVPQTSLNNEQPPKNDNTPSVSTITSESQEAPSADNLPDTEEYVIAMWDYQAAENNEISFSVGERIRVIKKDSTGWWVGVNTSGECGLFPSNYVEPI